MQQHAASQSSNWTSPTMYMHDEPFTPTVIRMHDVRDNPFAQTGINIQNEPFTPSADPYDVDPFAINGMLIDDLFTPEVSEMSVEDSSSDSLLLSESSTEYYDFDDRLFPHICLSAVFEDVALDRDCKPAMLQTAIGHGQTIDQLDVCPVKSHYAETASELIADYYRDNTQASVKNTLTAATYIRTVEKRLEETGQWHTPTIVYRGFRESIRHSFTFEHKALVKPTSLSPHLAVNWRWTRNASTIRIYMHKNSGTFPAVTGAATFPSEAEVVLLPCVEREPLYAPTVWNINSIGGESALMETPVDVKLEVVADVNYTIDIETDPNVEHLRKYLSHLIANAKPSWLPANITKYIDEDSVPSYIANALDTKDDRNAMLFTIAIANFQLDTVSCIPAQCANFNHPDTALVKETVASQYVSQSICLPFTRKQDFERNFRVNVSPVPDIDIYKGIFSDDASERALWLGRLMKGTYPTSMNNLQMQDEEKIVNEDEKIEKTSPALKKWWTTLRGWRCTGNLQYSHSDLIDLYKKNLATSEAPASHLRGEAQPAYEFLDMIPIQLDEFPLYQEPPPEVRQIGFRRHRD